jgi:UDP-glucose 4-epimerase
VLLEKGHQLRVLSRRVQRYPQDILQIQGDIRSAEAVHQLVHGCKAVIHLAGIAHTSLNSQSEIDEAERINVEGALNVLTRAQDAGVERVLLVSSAHVYAGQEGKGLHERSPTSSDSFYARTKLMVEEAGLCVSSANRLDVVILRPCLTYGPGVRFNLESLMRAIYGHYYFGVRGADPERSFLSVGNAAAAIAHLLQNGKKGEIYNVADQFPTLLTEFVNSLADHMHVSRPGNLPIFAIQAAIAGAVPLRWMGLRLPINRGSLRKLTASFSLDVTALTASGFRWRDDGPVTRQRMVERYLATRKDRKL